MLFENSTDEASYGSVRIQPQSYQDDLARVSLSTTSARIGNVKLSMMLRERLLSCHPTKTTYILFGTEKFKNEVRQELLRSPLMFGDFRMVEKEKYIYSGDKIDTRGMAGSMKATIIKRLGRIKGAMYEVAAIMSDPRMQAMSAWPGPGTSGSGR